MRSLWDALVIVVVLVALSTTDYAIAAARGRSTEHYALTTIRILHSRTEIVIDEVWSEEDRWRLERKSDGWDNGLIAINDGSRMAVLLPQLTEVLVVPASVRLDFAMPSRLMSDPLHGRLACVGEEMISGKRVLVLRGNIGGIRVQRWVDQHSQRPVREERYDGKGRPLWVQMRSELPVSVGDSERFRIDRSKISSHKLNTWKTRAISAWTSEQLSVPLQLPVELPARFRLDGAEVLKQQDVTVVVLRLVQEGRLVSLFLAPSSGRPLSGRRLLDGGRAVQARRIGPLDVTMVGLFNSREAEEVFQALAHQLEGLY